MSVFREGLALGWPTLLLCLIFKAKHFRMTPDVGSCFSLGHGQVCPNASRCRWRVIAEFYDRDELPCTAFLHQQ